MGRLLLTCYASKFLGSPHMLYSPSPVLPLNGLIDLTEWLLFTCCPSNFHRCCIFTCRPSRLPGSPHRFSSPHQTSQSHRNRNRSAGENDLLDCKHRLLEQTDQVHVTIKLIENTLETFLVYIKLVRDILYIGSFH